MISEEVMKMKLVSILNFSLISVLIILLMILSIIAVSVPKAVATEFFIFAQGNQSIQATINAADDEDLIILNPGIYIEQIDFGGKAITLKSTDPNDPDVIANTIIDGNQAGCVITCNSEEGGGSVLKGLTIRNGHSQFGGGIYCASSSPSITKCIISGNSSNWGGGICCEYSSNPAIINCTINGNTAFNGGGIYCFDSCTPCIIKCNITGNSGDWGGAICCDYSSPIINRCLINENSISADGGGIYFYSSAPKLTNCTITGNSGDFGAGVCCDYSFAVFSHCLITNNSASGNGGGIYCSSSSPGFTNCTISGNTASSGGGIECYDSSPYIVNSIFWDNNSEIHFNSGSNPKFSYCDIKGEGEYQGLGNIKLDPSFINTLADDYSLGPSSPCINAGHPRIYDSDSSRSDIGSYGGQGGFESASINITVATDGSGDYTSIQDAVDYAVAGDIITVFPGTYRENLVIINKDIVLISKGEADSTIIDGSGLGTVICLANLGPNAKVEGFTIQNGANSSYGGGISCDFLSLSNITDCIINDNSSINGGGIYCSYSTPRIDNCIIRCNFSDCGGGVCCDPSSTPSINNCTISGNSASNGGGIGCYDSSPEITSCLINENSASDDGGGIYCFSSSPNIINCIIIHNSGDWGGGINCTKSSPSISNCTISKNLASEGGAIECTDSSSPNIANSILWNNSWDEIYASDSTPIVTYTSIVGGYEGKGNINTNPLFIDPNEGDFRLISNSPCIDLGDPNLSTLPLTDKDGNSRIFNGKPDMGAYEFIRVFTLCSGLNLVSFPLGLEWNSFIDQNVPFSKIQTYEPETSTWLTLNSTDKENFSFSFGKGWLVYITQKGPETIDFYFPNAGSALEFDPLNDFSSGANLLNYYSLSQVIDICENQQLIRPENFFRNLNQKTGKESTCITKYDKDRGKWQVDYQFFNRTAGLNADLINEGYIIYLK